MFKARWKGNFEASQLVDHSQEVQLTFYQECLSDEVKASLDLSKCDTLVAAIKLAHEHRQRKTLSL